MPPELEYANAVGTTRDEALHARLNRHFREVTSINVGALSVALRAWLEMDVAVSLCMLQKGLPHKMKPADERPYVTEGIVLFNDDTWQHVQQQPRTVWTPERSQAHKIRKLRKGLTVRQTRILKAVRTKLAKPHRIGFCQP